MSHVWAWADHVCLLITRSTAGPCHLHFSSNHRSFICAIARCFSVSLPTVNSGIETCSPHQCCMVILHIYSHMWEIVGDNRLKKSNLWNDCHLISFCIWFRIGYYCSTPVFLSGDATSTTATLGGTLRATGEASNNRALREGSMIACQDLLMWVPL